MTPERAPCKVCGQSYVVNADGRIRKHKSPGSRAICPGSGRPTNEALDSRDREIARLRAENAALRSRLERARDLEDVARTWAELTTRKDSTT